MKVLIHKVSGFGRRGSGKEEHHPNNVRCMSAPTPASIPESDWLTHEISSCSVLTQLDWIASVFHNSSTFMIFPQGDRDRSKSLNLHVRGLESFSYTVALFIELCTPLVQKKTNLNPSYWNLNSFMPPSNRIVQTRLRRPHSLLVPPLPGAAAYLRCRWSVSGLTRQQLIKLTVCN